jgi:inositol oxygenase
MFEKLKRCLQLWYRPQRSPFLNFFISIFQRVKHLISSSFFSSNTQDASDPDMDLPNKLHLLQTAEGIRRAGHPDWFQLVGLLHDMGKIMFLWGTSDDGQDGTSGGSDAKQWALGGDTFVVGCRIPDSAVVFPQFNPLNPDMQDFRYNTVHGMYQPHCGLDQLCFAWGHDEYMYRMLVANETTIPPEGLDMIRYHSAYPMHDKGAYKHLLQPSDEDRLEWVRLFNRFDLYTKDGDNDIRENMDELWPYYQRLLEKYGLDGALKW